MSVYQAVRATRAERLAQAAAQAEAQQRQKAEASEKKAAEEAAVAKAVSEFLQQDLLGLGGAEEQLASGIEPDPNLKLVTLLERAAAKVDGRFADQPRVARKCRTPWPNRSTASVVMQMPCSCWNRSGSMRTPWTRSTPPPFVRCTIWRCILGRGPD